MNKKSLSHAQMAVVVSAAILLGGPSFYLAVVKDSPWLAIASVVAAQGWTFWNKRRSVIE